jgi:hypothetical protein
MFGAPYVFWNIHIKVFLKTERDLNASTANFWLISVGNMYTSACVKNAHEYIYQNQAKSARTL